MNEPIEAGVRYRVRFFEYGQVNSVSLSNKQTAENFFFNAASKLLKKQAVVLDHLVYGKRSAGGEDTCTILSGESIKFATYITPKACAKSKKTSKKLVVPPAKKVPAKKVKKGKK